MNTIQILVIIIIYYYLIVDLLLIIYHLNWKNIEMYFIIRTCW